METGFTFTNTLAAILTIGIISFLWRDNPLYKVCEALFVGVSAGYWFVSLWYQNLLPQLFDNLGISQLFSSGSAEDGALQVLFKQGRFDDRLFYLVAGLLGLMMLMRLIPNLGWISRWPLGFIIGTTSGLYFTTYFQSNAMAQLKSTVLPFTTVGNIVMVVGTICGLVYFYFSKEHKGALGGAAKIGTWFLMITFGASFGYTVMSRMSLLIGRFDFLFSTWLGLVK
ncbi:MAG: hypothetical protein CO189_11915 [candidate division Zixibacteria bacterium CG_4_9_14_3_um_filter_46_8]|nr:MAG: hypothetical protein CO189_11915 [candidate division Zixibacteria bacterium CG_4_9_14_3_um_filter_46_8]